MSNTKFKFKGMTIGGDWVEGNLNILENKYQRIEPGHYISNSAGAPFAYQVRPETVTALPSKEEAAPTGTVQPQGRMYVEASASELPENKEGENYSKDFLGFKADGTEIMCYYSFVSSKWIEVNGDVVSIESYIKPISPTKAQRGEGVASL